MKTKETAVQAYQRNRKDIGALVGLITQETRRHADFARKDGMNWARVGDLAEVRRKLLETLAFLAQQDETFIEKRLATMRQGRR